MAAFLCLWAARAIHVFFLISMTYNFSLQLLRLQIALAVGGMVGNALPLHLVHTQPSFCRVVTERCCPGMPKAVQFTVFCNAAAVIVCYMAMAALFIGRTPLITVWTASQVAPDAGHSHGTGGDGGTEDPPHKGRAQSPSQRLFIKAMAVADAAQHGLRYPSHRFCHWLDGACSLTDAAPAERMYTHIVHSFRDAPCHSMQTI